MVYLNLYLYDAKFGIQPYRSKSCLLIPFLASKTILPYPDGSSEQTTRIDPQKEAWILSSCYCQLRYNYISH